MAGINTTSTLSKNLGFETRQFLLWSSDQYVIDEMFNRSKGDYDYPKSALLLQ